ncbi:hypothetical protein CDL15_Pgr018157 [Punica granatum]|uniref:Pentatricopeptide repeat-containing protein At4g19220, mitochondrial n=1 Tax=Punica granatum TaxID=22663 RepID=A0A218WJP9_PUNGR|nr:hypothetical protein CDL15_Pgr018157 [Punica granatum]PKI57261.1 hypothetical protein CRG98_022358 [Punica granatum]
MSGSSVIKLRAFSRIPGIRIGAPTEANPVVAGLSPFSTINKSFSTSDAHDVGDDQLFDEMPQRVPNKRSIHFDRVLSLLRTPAVLGDTAFPSTGHCLALKIGALSHLPVLTSLIMAYSRAGELCYCHYLFNEITDRDVIICNAMITALVDHGCFEEAMDLFSKMLSCEIGFSSTSLLLIVSSLICLGDLVQGRILHGLALRSGTLSDTSLCNALIDMYAKFGELLSSELVFHEMGSVRDTVSWNSVMSGFLHGNDPERCLLYFLGRARDGEKGDSVSLSCAISAASFLRNLRWGEVVHALSSKTGLENNPNNNSVANSLVSFYSACGHSAAAEMIFKEMVVKDTVSWNTVIEGLRLNGEIGEAFHLLHEMQFTAQNRPDKITLLTITSICADEMLLVEGRTVHGFILRGGMELDSSLRNSLMYMYAKCGRVEYALSLFESMIPRRDSVSWNTMISGYTQGGLNKAAQSLFREMLKGSLECSAVTLLAVLPSCDSPEFLIFGRLIHCWKLKSGFSYNNLVVNSIIYMYINCGELKTAFSLFRGDSDMKDVTSWNTVIGGCVQNYYFRESLDTFHLMMREGNASFDFVTLVSVLSACGNLELVSGGKLIHGLAVKALLGSETRVQNALMTMYGRCREIESARSVFTTGYKLNLCSWNCMISAFCQNKNPMEALNLFCHLDLEPDEFTITGIITACTQLGSITQGKQIHAHVYRFRLHKNPEICSALLDMYSNCGRLDLASQVFGELSNKSIIAWNSVISAYGYHGDGKKAIELFQEMCQRGNQPNNGTFTSLLSACSHSGLVKEGIYYYHHMFQDFGVEPIADHRVCVVDMLGRSGELLNAYRFIKQMAPRPESGPLGALLSWSNFYGDIELGREVAEALFKLDPENSGYYISLSNMYVAAGRWKEAVELRGVVEAKRLKKPPGYSLINVG